MAITSAPNPKLSAKRRRECAFIFRKMSADQRSEMVGWLRDAEVIGNTTPCNHATAAFIIEAVYAGGLKQFDRDTQALVP